MKDLVLRNRYTLLLTTLVVYMLVLVAEGMVTGREARTFEFENPYFDFNMNEFEEFRERRNSDDDEDARASTDDSGDV